MPADRDLTLPAPGARLRDLWRRLGVAGFWSWWGDQIGALIPARPRNALARRRARPMLVFDGNTATLWRPVGSDVGVAMTAGPAIDLSGDPAAVLSAGRAALAELARATNEPTRLLVGLGPRSVLRKTLVLPSAVEENLRQTIAYDLDRHTPFKPEEMYFDAVVRERDAARGEIGVELASARRVVVDAAVRHAQSWGATVSAVVPADPGASGGAPFNLLPPELRVLRPWWRRWQVVVPLALLAGITAVALVLPIWQKREYAIALNAQAGVARDQAAVSERLRAELDRLAGEYNFALERKYQYPGTVQVLEDVTKLLPDDTWLTQLELKGTTRGKDVQRELQLRGESANAGRLVTLLEDSKLFTQAAPRSPTTKIQPGPGEIFDVGAQLKAQAAPPPVPLVVAGNDVAPVPGAAPAAAGTPALPGAGATAPSVAGVPPAGGASSPSASGTPPPATSGAPPSPAAGTPAPTVSGMPAPTVAGAPAPPAAGRSPVPVPSAGAPSVPPSGVAQDASAAPSGVPAAKAGGAAVSPAAGGPK